MRTKFLAVFSACVCFAAVPGANAASDAASVKKAIVAMTAAGNKGDATGYASALAKGGTVIDEFTPYHWSSFDAWGKAVGSYYAQNGITGATVKILKFAHVNVEGGRAYAVVSVIYSSKEGGKLKKEP